MAGVGLQSVVRQASRVGDVTVVLQENVYRHFNSSDFTETTADPPAALPADLRYSWAEIQNFTPGNLFVTLMRNGGTDLAGGLSIPAGETRRIDDIASLGENPGVKDLQVVWAVINNAEAGFALTGTVVVSAGFLSVHQSA